MLRVHGADDPRQVCTSQLHQVHAARLRRLHLVSLSDAAESPQEFDRQLCKQDSSWSSALEKSSQSLRHEFSTSRAQKVSADRVHQRESFRHQLDLEDTEPTASSSSQSRSCHNQIPPQPQGFVEDEWSNLNLRRLECEALHQHCRKRRQDLPLATMAWKLPMMEMSIREYSSMCRLAQFRIDRVTKCTAEHVVCKHGEEDRCARENCQPPHKSSSHSRRTRKQFAP